MTEQQSPVLPNSDSVTFVPISGFSGYAIGNNGVVLSCRSLNGKGLSKKWRPLKPDTHGNGHLIVGLRNLGKTSKLYISQLVATHFLGLKHKGRMVHIDGDKANNSVGNLRFRPVPKTAKPISQSWAGEEMPSLPTVEGIQFRHVPNRPGFACSDNGMMWTCKCRNGVGYMKYWAQMAGRPSHGGYLRLRLRLGSRNRVAYKNINVSSLKHSLGLVH